MLNASVEINTCMYVRAHLDYVTQLCDMGHMTI